MLFMMVCCFQEFLQVDRQHTDDILKMALNRLEIGGLFAPHFKPNLCPAVFVSNYGCLVDRLNKDRQKTDSGGKWGNLSLQVISMLLTKVTEPGCPHAL